MNRRLFLSTAPLALPLLASAARARTAAAAGPAQTVGDDDRLQAARFHNARRFETTRFGEISLIDRGRGPVTLFLHGFPLNGFQWRGVIDRVAGIRRCIAPDFLGLGYTRPAPGQTVAPADQADMLIDLLAGLEIDSVDIVANDSGGAVAQLFITRWAGTTRSLLLTNCDVEPDSPPPALEPVIALAQAGTFPDAWLVPWFNDTALARSPEGIGGLCYSRPGFPSDSAVATYFGPLVADVERKALTCAYALGLTPNPLAGIEAKLRRSQVPTRILWGTADAIFSPDSPDYLDRILPQSRGVRRVPHAKLFFPEEYPELVADEARRLWA